MLRVGAASLLQVGASVVTNLGSYYKLGQPLLQNRADITNWGKIYYKLGHNRWCGKQTLELRVMLHLALFYYLLIINAEQNMSFHGQVGRVTGQITIEVAGI